MIFCISSLIQYNNNTIIQGRLILLTWNLQSDRPIYTQLLERIQLNIVSGVYNPGEKLPSVRELAAEASVNPNTMQKAFAELERTGLIYTQRTAGRFITGDEKMIQELRNALAIRQIREFIEKMQLLGFKKEEIKLLIEEAATEE